MLQRLGGDVKVHYDVEIEKHEKGCKITLLRVLLLILVFVVGLALDYLLAGGAVTMVPAQGNETLAR